MSNSRKKDSVLRREAFTNVRFEFRISLYTFGYMWQAAIPRDVKSIIVNDVRVPVQARNGSL